MVLDMASSLGNTSPQAFRKNSMTILFRHLSTAMKILKKLDENMVRYSKMNLVFL